MRITGRGERWLLSTALIALALAVSGAQAQTTQTAGASGVSDPDEIIVTANKRAERLQDVALSITAVTADELNRQQVRDIQDLSQRVAGLNFQRAGSISSGLRIVLRGLNTGGNGPTVNSVFDDVPLSFSSPVSNGASRAVDLEPWDLSQIEVLRGPQGNLYGANALGGLIKYVSAAPDLNNIVGGFDVGGFNLAHGDWGGSGKAYLSVPIVADKLALRVSGYYEDTPGWINNALGGREDANGFERYGGRASLLWTPTDALTIRLTALAQKLDSDGFDAIEVNGVFVPDNQFASLNGYNLDTFLDQPSSVESQLYFGNFTYDFGRVILQSITSYGTLDNFITNDVPIYAQAFGGLLLGRPNTTLFFETDSKLRKFNQELRIASDNNSAREGRGLQWQAGVFYTYEKVNIPGQYFTRDTISGERVVTPASPDTALVLDSDLPQNYREIAGYADLTYYFSPKFDLEVGGRVFNNKQRARGVLGGALGGAPLGTDQGTRRSEETSGTFAVASRYHFDRNAMVYARVATGYRPGGPQNPIPNGPPGLPTDFSSDSTINYEVGFKGSAFDRLLSIDVAAFYIDWSDVQVNVVLPLNGIGFTIVSNAGKAVSKGIEWNITATPTRGLTLAAIGAYTDATLTQDAPGIGGLKGDRLPYVPELSLTLTANYEWDLNDTYSAYVGGSFSHTGDRLSSYALTPSISHLPVPEYNTFAGQIGVRTERYGIMLYGKNIGDERGITNYFGGQAVFDGVIPAQVGLIRPREIGIRLMGNF